MKKMNYFIIISCIFLTFLVVYYGGRMIYFYQLSKKVEKVGEVTFKEVLHNKTYNSSIQKEEDNLYYRGEVLNNYVYYSNRYFRVLGVEDDHVLLVDGISTILPFQNDFENSDIYSWLQNTYIKTLSNYEKYLDNMKTCIDQNCQNSVESQVGLLSISQYEKANYHGNFLNNKNYYWLSNGSYVNKTGNILEKDEGIYGVRAVLRLKKDVAYYGGTGTYYDPYFITLEDAFTFSGGQAGSIQVGSYISYSDKVWKVTKIEDTIQLVAKDSIGKFAYSNKHNGFDVSDKSSIAYYLNHTFLDQLDKKYLKEGTFSIGAYENSYLDQDKETLTAYVGLLKMGDLFINNNNSFLLTNTGKKHTVYKVMDGMLYADSYQSKNDIYPVIHLDKEINIKEGYGTVDSPFVVGA